MEQNRNFRSLTALKGIFILIIAVHNTLAVTPLFSGVPGTAFLILFGGILGNSMFYILSGFLLSAGYRDRIRSHSICFPDYLRRRLKKLYPLYLLSNGAALVIDLLRYGISALQVDKLVFTLLLVRGPYNHPTGFLCSLFVCYVLFFAVCHFSKSSTHYVSCITGGIIAGYLLISLDLDLPYLTSGTGTALMNFSIGCLLAEVYPRIPEKCHRWLQPGCLLLVPLLMYLMLSYGVEIIAGDIKVCFSFALCPMILYLALAKGPCCRLLQMRGLVALGSISSSVFFWHLVLYNGFCDVYGLLTQGETIGEIQYLLYFVLMLAVCAGSAWIQNRKGQKAAAL